MRAPLKNLWGPHFKRHHKFYRRLCTLQPFNWGSWTVMCIGTLGFYLTFLDIRRLLNGGPTLPRNLWRYRTEYQTVLAPELERDLKLMTSVVMLEYYMLMVIGVVTNNVVMYMPWLMIELVVMICELLTCCLSLFTDGLRADTSVLLVTVGMICNWLIVFCSFRKGLMICDL
ncbi:uncharacterized protein LOC113375008 [Ctenocephalides felis]|uniref:uncharacterized protein LOC113375008 n=1 Tax=Ctenocephalides felis TaxID=7515 RepID=UPI000E6E2381|nr:uncharacterized protein LOC113375008 [Ctenocephalides felis]